MGYDYYDSGRQVKICTHSARRLKIFVISRRIRQYDRLLFTCCLETESQKRRLCVYLRLFGL